MATRVFKKPRGTDNLYSNDEKLQLAELVAKRKEEYDAEVMREKSRYYAKRKKHVQVKPSSGFIARAVREFYTDLAEAKNEDSEFCKVVKLASQCLNETDQLRDLSICAPTKKRALVGGCKSKSMEVRHALFTWLFDVRESLKGRLPHIMFKLKTNEWYDEWLHENPTPESERLKFGN